MSAIKVPVKKRCGSGESFVMDSDANTEEAYSLKRLYSLLGIHQNEGDEESDGESGDCYCDEDTPILEKIGNGLVNFLNNLADMLDDFANKL